VSVYFATNVNQIGLSEVSKNLSFSSPTSSMIRKTLSIYRFAIATSQNSPNNAAFFEDVPEFDAKYHP
jgi:hypothetical protein